MLLFVNCQRASWDGHPSEHLNCFSEKCQVDSHRTACHILIKIDSNSITCIYVKQLMTSPRLRRAEICSQLPPFNIRSRFRRNDGNTGMRVFSPIIEHLSGRRCEHTLYRYNMYERNWIYASSLDLNNWSGRLPNSQRVSRDQDLSGVGVEVHCMCTFHSVSHCSSYRCCTEIDQQLLAFKNSFNPTALYWLINNICSFERELKTPIEIEKWPVTMSRGARARRTP